MDHPFGPWATLIDGGRNPRLSAFWRRRLTRLPALNRRGAALSKPTTVGLLLAAAALLALPTLHGWAVSAEPQDLHFPGPAAPALVSVQSRAPANRDDTTPRLTRTYAVDDVLSRIQQDRGVSLPESRLFLERHLRASWPQVLLWKGPQLVVQDTAAGHRGVDQSLEHFRKHGAAEVRVDVRFVTGPWAEFAKAGLAWMMLPSEPLHDYMSDGAPAMADFDQAGAGSTVGQPNRARFVIEKNVPILYRVLEEDQVAGLLRESLGNAKANVLQAPRVTLFNAQSAFVSDTSQTPFVVGVQDPARRPAVPQIKVVSEGVTVQMRPTLRGEGKVNLDFHIVFSKVQKVETVNVSASPSVKPVEIQVPEVATTSVKGGVEFPLENWLLLNGPEYHDPKRGDHPTMFVMMRVHAITSASP